MTTPLEEWEETIKKPEHKGKSTILHTVQAGNEISHEEGFCVQCDEAREFIKKQVKEL